MPFVFPPQLPALISQQDFNDFTSTWLDLVQIPNSDISSYFLQNGEPIYSIVFSRKAITSLISSTGINRVKAKFCIDKEGFFNIILFGSNIPEEDSQVSAYYLGTPCTADLIGGNSGGNLPDWLALNWIEEWKTVINAVTPVVSTDLFTTIDGELQGYTYDMEDFLNTFYYTQVLVDDFLCMHLAVHEHYKAGNDDANHPDFTFNQVLQGVDSQQTLSTNVFYDLATPCPPTC